MIAHDNLSDGILRNCRESSIAEHRVLLTGRASRHRQIAHRAQAAYQPLSHDQPDRVSHGVSGNADFDQPIDCVIAVAGMERGDDELAGKRRLERDFSRRTVAHFANENYFRIQSQQAAESRGHVESDGQVNLRLSDRLDSHLDRIFERRDAAAALLCATMCRKHA